MSASLWIEFNNPGKFISDSTRDALRKKQNNAWFFLVPILLWFDICWQLFLTSHRAPLLLWFSLFLPSRELQELQETRGSPGLRSDLSASRTVWKTTFCLKALAHFYVTNFIQFVFVNHLVSFVLMYLDVAGSSRPSWPSRPPGTSGSYWNPRTPGNRLSLLVCD